jgi:hypothetical protein
LPLSHPTDPPVVASDPADTFEKVKTQAEYCLKLAERAASRIQARRTVEWQVALGLWSAFGAGAGIVLTSTHATLNGWMVGIGIALAAFAVILYASLLLRYVKLVNDDDRNRSIEWEQEAIKLLQLPNIRPPVSERFIWKWFHMAQWMQLGITVLFALLFTGALLIRCTHNSTQGSQPSRMTVEGGMLDVDTPAVKLKLGK